MKLKKLNDNELQIIISHQDLRVRNLKKWDLVPYNPHAQHLFQEILEKASADCGFEVMQDTQLVVEAYPISDESMIITIRKFHEDREQYHRYWKDEKEDERPSLEAPISLNAGALQSQTPSTPQLGVLGIYEFETLEDAIEASHAIASAYQGGSRLYQSRDGAYFILLEDVRSLDGAMAGHLIEYGVRTPYSLAFLEEHTDCVIPSGAVHSLAFV